MKYPVFRILHLELLIILCGHKLVESERPKFRDDYRHEKGFNAFYKVHHTAAPWWVARVHCEAEGATLMVPSNLDEADTMPLLISAILNKYDGVFIGAHDLYSERLFVTIDGLTILDSILNLLWEHEEPTYGAGRCLAMHHNGRLFVHPCDTPLPYICKVDADDIIYYKECDTFDPRWRLGPNSTCYFMHTEPQIWFDAFDTCLSAGGHLAIMNSHSEAQYIRSLFKEIQERRLPDNDFAFLGFSDLFQRYHYRTIQGQNIEESGYADWTLTCVKQVNLTTANRCGGMKRSGLLAKSDCNVPAMFICEKHVQQTKLNDIKTVKTKKTTIKGKSSKRLRLRAGKTGTEANTSTNSTPPISLNIASATIPTESTPGSDSVKSLTLRETQSLFLLKYTMTIPSLATTKTTLHSRTEIGAITTSRAKT